TSIGQAEESKKKLLTCQKTSCDKSYFYVQILTRDILLIAELSGKLKICEKRKLTVNDISVDMSCIIYYIKDYYRATIISSNGYAVKCIDYEYIVQDININDLYCLPEDEIFFSVPLAKKCRVYGVDYENHEKALNDFKSIPSKEYMSIIIENEDADCLQVTLVGENNGIFNEKLFIARIRQSGIVQL
ncbi:unnamed protein product, partial [Adineta steineri]